MEIIDTIQSFLDRLEEKQFYRYAGIALLILSLLTGGMIFRYYQKLSSLKKQIQNINESREQIKKILDKAQQVEQQQKRVNEILAEEENFKIAEYFEGLLKLETLNLTNNLITRPEVIFQEDREGAYTEEILTAQFTGMTMKKLTELLQEIEKKQRIYIKLLEITTSKKTQNSIEIAIAIGTLLPKAKEVE